MKTLVRFLVLVAIIAPLLCDCSASKAATEESMTPIRLLQKAGMPDPIHIRAVCVTMNNGATLVCAQVARIEVTTHVLNKPEVRVFLNEVDTGGCTVNHPVITFIEYAKHGTEFSWRAYTPGECFYSIPCSVGFAYSFR